jgi:hypothetical protein
MMDYFSPLYLCTPYHTSALFGADWVHELLTGHPERIRNELGIYQSTFTMLVKAMQSNGLQSSRHVSIEEQLAIFLYTTVIGLSCTHVGEHFQRSSSIITKLVLLTFLIISNRFPGILNGFYKHLQHPYFTSHLCSSLIRIRPLLPKSETHRSFIPSSMVL